MRTLRIAVLACVLAGCSSKEKSDGNGDGGPNAGPDGSMPRDAGSDAGATPDGGNEAMCPIEQRIVPVCTQLAADPVEDEYLSGLCDGYDNDCDESVDEGCPCEPGAVQSCFVAPPNQAGVGACREGVQTCSGALEFSGWGPCVNGIPRGEEVCDRLDNDCNGCVDDLPDCKRGLDCPGPDDPRVRDARPFETFTLDARSFYDGDDVATYTWQIEGSPCDRLFEAIPNAPAQAARSYTLTGADQQRARLKFALSGQYLVTLTMKLTGGDEIGCTFPLTVSGPGLRIELCWDKTGPTSAGDPIDLDLHLALKDTTSAFRVPGSDCYYDGWLPGSLDALGIWGHPNTTDIDACLTGDPTLDEVHRLRGNCINPRLDLDNQGNTDRYVPENINLDNPRPGEVFQVAVNHRSTSAQRTRALVNVYCGGVLGGSFELDPATAAFSDTNSEDELWRVVEIAPLVNAAGKTTGCDLTPLHPPGEEAGAWLTDGDFSISWAD